MRTTNQQSQVVPELRRLPGGDAGASAECSDDACITCSDEGRVAQVMVVHDDGRAEVLVEDRTEIVDISLVDAGPGDLLLVHAGVAITLLDPVHVPAARGDGATAAGAPSGSRDAPIEVEAGEAT